MLIHFNTLFVAFLYYLHIFQLFNLPSHFSTSNCPSPSLLPFFPPPLPPHPFPCHPLHSAPVLITSPSLHHPPSISSCSLLRLAPGQGRGQPGREKEEKNGGKKENKKRKERETELQETDTQKWQKIQYDNERKTWKYEPEDVRNKKWETRHEWTKGKLNQSQKKLSTQKSRTCVSFVSQNKFIYHVRNTNNF